MNKFIFAAVTVIILAVVAFAFIGVRMFLSPGPGEPTDTNEPTGQYPNIPNPNTGQTSTENTKQITLENGETLLVRDFLAVSSTRRDPYNKDQYYLGNLPTTEPTDAQPFAINYLPNTNYFNVVLLRKPLGAARLKAEGFLIQQLNITQNQMCDLRYTVSVPFSVDEEYAGTSLGFSYCPGATELP